jgi:hypothetical protein
MGKIGLGGFDQLSRGETGTVIINHWMQKNLEKRYNKLSKGEH